MERKIDRQASYKRNKNKMIRVILIILLPAIAIFGTLLYVLITESMNLTDMGTLYIPLLIGYLIVLFLMVPRVYESRMLANYSRLLLNEPSYLSAKNAVFTSTWIEQLKLDGYELVQEDMKHLLLCKYYKKLPDVSSSDSTLVFIAIAKRFDFDFYSDEIDQGIQALYMNHQDYGKVSKRITLQFKKYDTIKEEALKEIEKVILYEAGRQTMVNLSFFYDGKEDKMLSLSPGNWYPNRYVYFAFSEFKRLCGIKE